MCSHIWAVAVECTVSTFVSMQDEWLQTWTMNNNKMAGHGSCSYITHVAQSRRVFCECSWLLCVCVCVCVLSRGVLHGCVSRYLFFHQFNFQLFIHSKGYLFHVCVIFVIALESDRSQNQSQKEKFNFSAPSVLNTTRNHLSTICLHLIRVLPVITSKGEWRSGYFLAECWEIDLFFLCLFRLISN